MPASPWTKTPPTEPGWYWLLYPTGLMMPLEVVVGRYELVCDFYRGDGHEPVGDAPGLWGPRLVPPARPGEEEAR